MVPLREVCHGRIVRRLPYACFWALLAVAVGPGRAAVEVTFEELELTAWSARRVAEIDPAHPHARQVLPVTARQLGERRLQAIVLENEWLRMRLLPELGGAVFDVVHKPTGAQIFHRSDRLQDWRQFGDSALRPSFPSPVHGIGNSAQPAAWRVVTEPDGRVSVAFWMEFARHRRVEDTRTHGRFSTLRLSHRYSLHPDEALLRAEYRLSNPAPWRQGRRLWVEASFPRQHAPGAPEPPELILPALHVSGPRGDDVRSFGPVEARVADDATAAQLFGWGVRHGFAGVHYPGARVNRLVLFDATRSPGLRFAIAGNESRAARGDAARNRGAIELSTGTDTLPAVVGAWLEAGETWSFRQALALVPGIGRPDFANESFALHLEATAPVVELAVLRRTGELSLEWNGRPLATLPPQVPGAVVRLPLPEHSPPPGRITVAESGRGVVSAPLPLELVDDDALLADIRRSLVAGPLGQERNGEAAPESEAFRSALAGYPEGGVERGRILLRDGFTTGAERQLRTALARDGRQGETWHLLGVALAEQGRGSEAREAWRAALEAPQPHPPAAYELAIASLPHDAPMATALLRRLLLERPAHREAGLLLAALLVGQPEGETLRQALEAEDPADPRVAWLHVQAGAPAAQEELDRLVALEPGANRVVEQFASSVRGLRLATPRPAY
jgi:tetratricopeptide (TPR) repeat protein